MVEPKLSWHRPRTPRQFPSERRSVRALVTQYAFTSRQRVQGRELFRHGIRLRKSRDDIQVRADIERQGNAHRAR